MIFTIIILSLVNLILWSAVFYVPFFKRFYDIICAIMALTVFSWLYLIIAVLVKIKLGSPVVFTQVRPGKKGEDGKEKLFKLYKFRTMTDERDYQGNHLPDEKRLTKFGAFLRSTSLDEIPEAINILKGDMSVIGPRPQLVRDMVFMTEEQRHRHDIRPGLSGLAQVNGRNAVSWNLKLELDLKYIADISFFLDLKILVRTVKKVFMRGESAKELDLTDDYGASLLKTGKVTQEQYGLLNSKAEHLLDEYKEQ